MKQLILNETTKNQVRYFATEIVQLKDENITFCIPINDDDEALIDVLDEYYVERLNDYYFKTHFKPVTLNETMKYLKVYLNNNNFKQNEVDEKVVPAVIDAINKAIDEYNLLNENSNNYKREIYDLKDGFMSTHFEGFEFEYNVNRICVAKVIKDKEYDWINWVPKKGYNLNNIQIGDVIMVKKMMRYKNRDLDKIFYKVISISKDKLICEYGNGDKVYTTYLKALKG